jgi:hypothetical protein
MSLSPLRRIWTALRPSKASSSQRPARDLKPADALKDLEMRRMPSTVVPVHSALLSGATADHVLPSSGPTSSTVTSHDRNVNAGSNEGQGNLTITHEQRLVGTGPGHVIALYGTGGGDGTVVGGSGNSTVVGGGGNSII